EIDAVGRHRGIGLGGGNDEREQTLNQLLVEMDGFESNEGVIIVAATNRPDVLDPALLRPGRFDRQITISLPDINGRADLANLVNESALIAARRNKKIVTMDDFEYARDKVMMGVERRSLVMTEEERKLTAYHEAGHVILPLTWLHLIRYTKQLLFQEMIADITVAMGGRVAEELVFGYDKVTSGASSDIKQASDLSRAMYNLNNCHNPNEKRSKHGIVKVVLNYKLNKKQELYTAINRKVDLVAMISYRKKSGKQHKPLNFYTKTRNNSNIEGLRYDPEFQEVASNLKTAVEDEQFGPHKSPVEFIDEEGKSERLNSKAAIWTKPKNDVTQEEHNDLFVVLRMLAIIPQYLRFLKGIIDSPDLPLNISRETLQNNRVVEQIKKSLTKRVISELGKKAKENLEEYTKFWTNFGAVLKEGLCEAMPTDEREALLSICRFHSTSDDKLVSIDNYISRMKPEQEYLYYLTGTVWIL
ncbi:unnamed protein product, partial [Ceratitis capitata]